MFPCIIAESERNCSHEKRKWSLKMRRSRTNTGSEGIGRRNFDYSIVGKGAKLMAWDC